MQSTRHCRTKLVSLQHLDLLKREEPEYVNQQRIYFPSGACFCNMHSFGGTDREQSVFLKSLYIFCYFKNYYYF